MIKVLSNAIVIVLQCINASPQTYTVLCVNYLSVFKKASGAGGVDRIYIFQIIVRKKGTPESKRQKRKEISRMHKNPKKHKNKMAKVRASILFETINKIKSPFQRLRDWIRKKI